MGLRVAERWFEIRRLGDGVTHLWESHVDPLIRCNIWHVRGRDRDLLVDSGLGLASLCDAARHLFEQPVVAVATHTHFDHIGGHHEFAERVVHRAEAEELRNPTGFATLLTSRLDRSVLAAVRASGYEVGEELITALPWSGFDLGQYRLEGAPPTRLVEDGDRIDLGDRGFEILHLPGHSPGSIGLWDPETGTLFSGDAIYDGPLIDELPHSNIGDYLSTMRRLRALPVVVVHAGHEPSFGRERLVELSDAYLRKRAGKASATAKIGTIRS